jgi:hypothetical protein
MMTIKYVTKGPTALTAEIEYDQTAMGLPPVTSVVCLIAKSFWQNGNLGRIFATYLETKGEWC